MSSQRPKARRRGFTARRRVISATPPVPESVLPTEAQVERLAETLHNAARRYFGGEPLPWSSLLVMKGYWRELAWAAVMAGATLVIGTDWTVEKERRTCHLIAQSANQPILNSTRTEFARGWNAAAVRIAKLIDVRR